MTGKWLPTLVARRSFLNRLGVGVGVLSAASLGSSSAMAVAAPAENDPAWHPARHEQDAWYDKIPGVHRFVFDTTTSADMALALRFAGNYFNVNETAYSLKETDLAV